MGKRFYNRDDSRFAHPEMLEYFNLTRATVTNMAAGFDPNTSMAVSYTHLDVYKRQFQASTKDEIIRQIEAMKDEYVQAGTVAKKLVYEKGALYIA